jgi:proteasomal ATPase-associated factor 1
MQVILTTSSDLSIRIFGLDGANPRTLKGHYRAITSTAILGVGKQILSGSKDGTVRLWDVGGAKELRVWSTEGRAPVEALVLLDGPAAVAELGLGVEDEWAVLAFTQAGNVEVFHPTRKAESAPGRMTLGVAGQLLTVAYDPERKILATGHSSGVVSVRPISALKDGETSPPTSTLIRRNESPVYSLAWAEGDLLMGTAAGMPCRLGMSQVGEGKMEVTVKEELAGWDAVGVDGFAVTPEGVWCGGGDGAVRRY